MNYRENNGEGKIAKIAAFAAFVIACIVLIASANVHAATGELKIVSIDYETSTLTVKPDGFDSSLYLSDSAQKKWEYIPIAKNSGGNVVIDISWVSLTKDYTISIKGNYSSPVKVVIPKQATNFKGTYNTYSGLVTFTNQNSRAIEWKKKEALEWNSYPTDTAEQKKLLDSLCANGATILFRLAAVAGDGTSAGMRPGKEISVTITKKSAAPSITVDDEKLSIAVSKGLQYRYTDSDGIPLASNPATGRTGAGYDGEWITINTNTNKKLAELAPYAVYNNMNTTLGTGNAADGGAVEDVYIQFRNSATSSRQVSNTTTVKIPAQNKMSASVLAGIKLEYTSNTTFSLTINAADTTNAYEYCIINQDDLKYGVTINDVEDTVWKSVTDKKAIVIDEDNDDIGDGSLVYVRKKAKESLGSDKYELATPWICVSDGISYPGPVSVVGAQANSLVWLQTTAGRCSTDNSEGYMSFRLYSPTESVVTKLEFVDYYSRASRGTVSFKSTVETNPEAAGNPDKKYIITTTVTSTESIDKYASNKDTREMLAYLTIGSAVTESSDEDGGIALYLHPATAVNNPGNTTKRLETAQLLKEAYPDSSRWASYAAAAENDKIGYSTAMTRVYGSNRFYTGVSNYSKEYDATSSNNYDECDASEFKVRLDFGTRYVPAYLAGDSEAGALSGTEVKVTKIKYDGVEFDASSGAFLAEYANTRTDDNKSDLRFAVLTVYADVIERNTVIDDRNTDTPVIVYLNNGEILETVLTLNLRETASINAVPIAYSFTEGTLKEKDVSSYTVDGITYTKEEKYTTYRLSLTVFKSSYNVGVKSVTWGVGGANILDCADVGAGTISISLSDALLNRIDVDTSQTKNIVITLSNGSVINTGKCTLSISPASK